MSEKRGRGKPPARKIAEQGEGPVVPALDSSLSESQLARLQLRQRWELASVLNFLHVFQPVIQSNLKISAEEIETALITPNGVLARLHIALLQGIPPVNKNMTDPDAWVTVLCKKLALWWPWVAEGEIPLKADHGVDILRYKELDPTTRLMILKALCEVRAEQDDILSYITDTLKKGTQVTTFRKDRIGGDDSGTSYWYDGDSIIGHRLYREVVKVDIKQKVKGKGHSAQPTSGFRWETLATNLDEFQEISDKLSSSKIMAEVAVGERVKTDIVPLLEELQKKKERALKRQQREGLLLDGLLYSNGIGINRSRRDRRPVNYTFDEFDRSIDEAIQISKNSKMDDLHNDDGKQVDHVSGQDVTFSGGSLGSDKENSIPGEVHMSPPEIDDDDKYRGSGTGDDDEDDDYDDKDDDHNDSTGDDDADNDDLSNSDKKKGRLPLSAHLGPAQKKRDEKTRDTTGLRRSSRRAGNASHGNLDTYNAEATGHGDMKKRLRQRPTRNADYNVQTVSDSEDGNLSENEEQGESDNDGDGDSDGV